MRLGHHFGEVFVWGVFPPGLVYPMKQARRLELGQTLLNISKAIGCEHMQYPLGPPICMLFPVMLALPLSSIYKHSEQIGTFFFMPHPSL